MSTENIVKENLKNTKFGSSGLKKIISDQKISNIELNKIYKNLYEVSPQKALLEMLGVPQTPLGKAIIYTEITPEQITKFGLHGAQPGICVLKGLENCTYLSAPYFKDLAAFSAGKGRGKEGYHWELEFSENGEFTIYAADEAQPKKTRIIEVNNSYFSVKSGSATYFFSLLPHVYHYDPLKRLLKNVIISSCFKGENKYMHAPLKGFLHSISGNQALMQSMCTGEINPEYLFNIQWL